jgi:hypothetical protein
MRPAPPTVPLPFEGGCACQAVRYRVTAKPVAMLNCHCRDCQRSSGTAYSSILVVPAPAFTLLQGAPRAHETLAESGNRVRREHCPTCGAPLFARNASLTGFVGIRPASLDDPSWFSPTVDIWTASAHPWDVMDPDRPRLPRGPTDTDRQGRTP